MNKLQTCWFMIRIGYRSQSTSLEWIR